MDSIIAGAPIAADPVPGRTGAEGGAARHWRVLQRLEKTAIGAHQPDGAVSVRRHERAGILLFGPYWRLPGGRYRLSFRCRAGPPRFAGQPVLAVEAIALNRNQQGWRDFTAEELSGERGSLDFEVPSALSLEAGEEARFEFRFVHLGNADLRVGAVDLRRLDPEEGELPCAPATWRLLGRCVTSAIARRRAGAVVVRRLAPPGVALRGPWPYLRLPEGRYRLTLEYRAGVPRRPAQPVIGVEVIGHSRWRTWLRHLFPWRVGSTPDAVELCSIAFTAEESHRGSVSADFAVPLELSLESGDDVPLELRVRHFGNADLTVLGIDLRPLDDGEPMPAGASVAARPLTAVSRRKVVVIGNCQAETVREAFFRAPPLSRRFTAKYHFVGLPKHFHEAARRELAEADLILVQDIQDWESYPLRDAIPRGVETITFPPLRFASLWPFDHYNGPGDKEAHDREWPNLAFLYQDGLLGRLRREIPDKEARFRAYRGLELDGIINYVRLHDFEKRRLLALDRRFGFAIGAYVLANFQAKQLFYTTVHPNRQLVTMLMEWLTRRLGIDEPFPHVARLDHLKRLQVPIHPKVARALGVTWADEHTRYSYEGRPVTWESYTRAYIEHYG